MFDCEWREFPRCLMMLYGIVGSVTERVKVPFLRRPCHRVITIA